MKDSLGDMYPIKHPFIYESKMKLTGLFLVEDAKENQNSARQNRNVDNAVLIKQSSQWWILQNIASGTDQKGRNSVFCSSSLSVFVIIFHCSRVSQCNENVVENEILQNYFNKRRQFLLADRFFVVSRIENIAQCKSKILVDKSDKIVFADILLSNITFFNILWMKWHWEIKKQIFKKSLLCHFPEILNHSFTVCIMLVKRQNTCVSFSRPHRNVEKLSPLFIQNVCYLLWKIIIKSS